MGLSQAEMDDLQDAFRLFDTNNSGYVLVKDLRAILNELAEEPHSVASRQPNLTRLLQTTQAMPDDKKLSFDEFIKLITKPDPNDTRHELRKVFDLFDAGGKGYIDAEDLGRVASELGETMANEELEEMIQTASSSGKVYPQDFETIMQKKLFSL